MGSSNPSRAHECHEPYLLLPCERRHFGHTSHEFHSLPRCCCPAVLPPSLLPPIACRCRRRRGGPDRGPSRQVRHLLPSPSFLAGPFQICPVSRGADSWGVLDSQEELTIERAATQEEERLRYLEFVQQAAAQVLAALPRRRPHRGHRQGCRGACLRSLPCRPARPPQVP